MFEFDPEQGERMTMSLLDGLRQQKENLERDVQKLKKSQQSAEVARFSYDLSAQRGVEIEIDNLQHLLDQLTVTIEECETLLSLIRSRK